MHIVCSETYWNLQLRYYTGAQEIVNNKLKFLILDDPGDSDWPKPLAYKIRKSLYYHISSPVGMQTIYLTSRVTVGEKGKEKTTYSDIVVYHQQILRHTTAYKLINYINSQ